MTGMFEPGDELEAFGIEPSSPLADHIANGQKFICKEFIPEGHGCCPECGGQAATDAVLLVGLADVITFEIVVLFFKTTVHAFGYPAHHFRKIERRRDLEAWLRQKSEDVKPSAPRRRTKEDA